MRVDWCLSSAPLKPHLRKLTASRPGVQLQPENDAKFPMSDLIMIGHSFTTNSSLPPMCSLGHHQSWASMALGLTFGCPAPAVSKRLRKFPQRSTQR